MEQYIRLCRITGIVLAIVLSAIYLLGARPFYGMFFSDEEAISQGISYTYIAAALTLLQIVRIINVGAMRSMGDVKSPRIMATLCVLVISPAVAFVTTKFLNMGVWGIWLASLSSQIVWCTLSIILERKCLKNVLAS